MSSFKVIVGETVTVRTFEEQTGHFAEGKDKARAFTNSGLERKN